jgi:hypothetical protein
MDGAGQPISGYTKMMQVHRAVAIMWLIFTILFLGMAAWHWYLSGQAASDLNVPHLQNMLAAGGYFLAALTSLISFLIAVREKRHITKNSQAAKHYD